MKDKNILKSDLRTIIHCYDIGLLFASQTYYILIFYKAESRIMDNKVL